MCLSLVHMCPSELSMASSILIAFYLMVDVVAGSAVFGNWHSWTSRVQGFSSPSPVTMNDTYEI